MTVIKKDTKIDGRWYVLVLLHSHLFNEILSNNRVLTPSHDITFSLNTIPLSYPMNPISPPAHLTIIKYILWIRLHGSDVIVEPKFVSY
jgi:hypothetical protein